MQKRIKELMEEMYPTTQRAEDITKMAALIVQKATSPDVQLKDVIAAFRALTQFSGAESEGPTTKVLHGHIVQPQGLPGPVANQLKLPKE